MDIKGQMLNVRRALDAAGHTRNDGQGGYELSVDEGKVTVRHILRPGETRQLRYKVVRKYAWALEDAGYGVEIVGLADGASRLIVQRGPSVAASGA
ncbi:hypothetical protein IMZ11_02480 [Microtetraspora sp. AC03309]|uniref:hypothetical protein n=1 Tax=Microtetraspora sp. AC03309 TaxID=2779376 RepID=UPI001E64C0A7|nr:hypothetical protein [Microtetraspora sp. AC03309]MCC5574505.1 hypothetical protein [Microtetraspora sp. AC03309]